MFSFRTFLALPLLASLFCLPLGAHAAILELATAVDQAIKNSPVLQEAREKQEEYRFQASVSRATLFPQLDIGGNATRRKDAVANKLPAALVFGGDSYNLYTLGATLDQPILVWGALAAVRQAGIDYDVSALEQDITARDLTRDVVAAYYRVVLYQNFININLEQEGVIKEALNTARTRLGLGGRRLDLLQVRTRLALIRPQIEKARNDLAAAAAELAKLMGDTSLANFELRGTIPTLLYSNVEKSLNLKEFRLPELDKLRLARERLDEQRSIVLGKQLPSLRFKGDYTFTNYTKAELFDPSATSWSAQLVLSVPLFSGLSSIFERKAVNAQDRQLEAQERETANSLGLAQVRSRKVLDSAGASLGFAEEAAGLARESMTQAARDYRFGQIDFLQYLQVQQSNFEAVTSLSQWRYDNIVALADYFRASGQPLSTLVSTLNSLEAKR
ncbi:MAG: TolC family protein [Proteobacteria bacterium]|nr:MAG: TolC family protein [Pseudomonadota bacterium]